MEENKKYTLFQLLGIFMLVFIGAGAVSSQVTLYRLIPGILLELPIRGV
jgi:hypothetical protein